MLDLISAFTGYSLWEYITCFFDNIVKVIYLIYTAIASCLDLLQCVMRKLAGLDTYWINGNAYTKQDPVLSFIYGMLGFDGYGQYSALSTVFWSLAIFGVIVLVISTIVAIIKSHYGEDSNKTNPLTYVYTAVKAVFTFAIVPVAVVLGIYLSQFLLQTLDNITGGYVTEDTLKGIYGSTATEKFEGSSENGYSHYDFFGYGPETTSTTFSGMLFRVAGYDANRVRMGTININSDDVKNHYLHNVFNQDQSVVPSGVTNEQWTAYQIDFAFMNNLYLEGRIYAGTTYSAAQDVVLSIASVDFFKMVGSSPGFSKYNVGLIWCYYYLWNFNFFVGFASIIISFGLLTSIILGLMARLIQSAALFLIYPAVLGLAPLDEFGAFKKWRGEFMGYILMAFGSIIGMNIFFLILPYVEEFNWFGWPNAIDLPSKIINTLIIIVGLLAVKSFIAFVSSLIGGKDARAEGDGMKKELSDVSQKAGKGLMLAAGVGLKGGMFLQRTAGKAIAQRAAAGKANKLGDDIARDEATLNVDDSEFQRNFRMADAGKTLREKQDGFLEVADLAEREKRQKALDAVDARAVSMGIEKDSVEYKQMVSQAKDSYLMSDDDYRKAKQTIANEGYTDNGLKVKQALDEKKTQRQQLVESYGLGTAKEDGTKRDRHGELKVKKGDAVIDKGSVKSLFKNVAVDAIAAMMKGLQEGTKDVTGINMKSIMGVFQAGTNYKFDDKGNVSGSYAEDLKDMGGSVRQTFGSIGRTLFAVNQSPIKKAEDAAKETAAASKKIEQAADKILKAAETFNRHK